MIFLPGIFKWRARDYEGFTGVYKWCNIEVKKKASITVNIEGTIDKNLRLVLVQNDKSIKDIKMVISLLLIKEKPELYYVDINRKEILNYLLYLIRKIYQYLVVNYNK